MRKKNTLRVKKIKPIKLIKVIIKAVYTVDHGAKTGLCSFNGGPDREFEFVCDGEYYDPDSMRFRLRHGKSYCPYSLSFEWTDKANADYERLCKIASKSNSSFCY